MNFRSSFVALAIFCSSSELAQQQCYCYWTDGSVLSPTHGYWVNELLFMSITKYFES